MAKSLNRAQLIGNLTRDPELRYTEKGTAVCAFGLATNRSYTTDKGEQTETEFHRIVCFGKLAETCDQYLTKGGKVYVSGRLHTRSYPGKDGTEKTVTEIVLEDMVMLDRREPVRIHTE